MGKFRVTLLPALAAILFAPVLQAVPVAYTDATLFSNALAGATVNTLTFEGQTAPSTVADGDTLEGITFNHDLADFGVSMIVTDGFDTTSPGNFLGTNDSNVFLDGDNFDLGFGPVNAIGMFFISADTMFDGDITLTAGGETASLVAGDGGADLGDGGIPYFLGIVDTMNSFTLAEIVAFGGDPNDVFFFFNVDDITTATFTGVSPIPLPGAVWLFLSGIMGLAALRRKQIHKQ